MRTRTTFSRPKAVDGQWVVTEKTRVGRRVTIQERHWFDVAADAYRFKEERRNR